MKVDLLYEIALKAPFTQRSEYEVYWQCLEQCVRAEEAGFSTIWEVEHHFLTEFSHSSAPEVFLTAVAMRTERIRIGHGVVLLPYPFNHPIRVAERIAVLDILSNGRVEFGTGRSGPYEQEGFGIDPRESRALWQEALSIIPRMWREDPFSYEGFYFKIPPRSILPKPVQKPHPPIWLACTSPESWRLAGKNGIGALGFSFFATLEELAEHIQDYQEALKEAVPVGEAINSRYGAFTLVHCAETEEEAVETAMEPVIWYIQRSFDLVAGIKPGSPPPEGAYASLARRTSLVQALQEKGPQVFQALREHNSIVVGTPDQCVEKLKAYERLGVDRVLCLMQMRGIPHQKVLRSLDLFGRYVIPEFQGA